MGSIEIDGYLQETLHFSVNRLLTGSVMYSYTFTVNTDDDIKDRLLKTYSFHTLHPSLPTVLIPIPTLTSTISVNI